MFRDAWRDNLITMKRVYYYRGADAGVAEIAVVAL